MLVRSGLITRTWRVGADAPYKSLCVLHDNLFSICVIGFDYPERSVEDTRCSVTVIWSGVYCVYHMCVLPISIVWIVVLWLKEVSFCCGARIVAGLQEDYRPRSKLQLFGNLIYSP